MNTNMCSFTVQRSTRLTAIKLVALLGASAALSVLAIALPCWTTTTSACITPGTSCDVHSPNCPGETYSGYATDPIYLGAWMNSATGYWNPPTTNACCSFRCQMLPELVDCRGQNVNEVQNKWVPVPETSRATPGCPGY